MALHAAVCEFREDRLLKPHPRHDPRGRADPRRGGGAVGGHGRGKKMNLGPHDIQPRHTSRKPGPLPDPDIAKRRKRRRILCGREVVSKTDDTCNIVMKYR